MGRLGTFLTAVALTGTAPVALADGGYTPPPSGLHIDFVYYDIDFDEYYRQDDTVIAVGDDFALHRARGYWDVFSTEIEWEDYYAEFSGFLVVTCTDEMPSEDVRKAAYDFWPLEPGKSVKLETDGFTWNYKVVETGDVSIAGKTYDTVTIEGRDLLDEDGYFELMSVSTELNTYLASEYDVMGKEIATAVAMPETDFRITEDIREQLGQCAALLDTATSAQTKQKSQGD